MATVVMAADWEQKLAAASYGPRDAAMGHAATTANRLCPRDTGELADSIIGEALETSMDCRLSAGGGHIDYAAVVELGSRPHEIRSHGNYPLRNRETGQAFGRVVHHPGTRAQPYLRPGVMSIGELG